MQNTSTFERNDRIAGALPTQGAAWLALVPALIVLFAVLFNPALAIINANFSALTSTPVIACEIALVFAAHAYAAMHFDRRMLVWYAFLAVLGTFALTRMLAVGSFDVKYLRDVLMIPTFIVLGLAARERHVIGCIVLLQFVVVGGILLEAISVEEFSALFNVKDYYVNTRGIATDEFTNVGSTLFVSATRPEARFFPFFDLHRLSSIFLEPVSLGNFAIVVVCFTMAFWSRLSVWQRTFLVASVVLTLVACDGRLSSMSVAAVLMVGLLSRLLPPNIALVFLPLVAIATVSVAVIGNFKLGTDDLPGRLAHTQHWLFDMSLTDLLGASNRLLPESEDSGLIYLLITQSLAGLALIWMAIVLGLEERTPAHKNYKNGICIYLSLIMMVSYSFVSIKTAAPLWFIYGFLIAWKGDETGDASEATT